MPGLTPRIRAATRADIDELLVLQAGYYREDGYEYHQAEARTAWEVLLTDTTVGRVWVAALPTALIGYVVVTFGFSLEYRGRDACLDELYVVPEWRRRRLGSSLHATAETGCIEAGVNEVHLEVEPNKQATVEMYRRRGFRRNGRVSMSKPMRRIQLKRGDE